MRGMPLSLALGGHAGWRSPPRAPADARPAAAAGTCAAGGCECSQIALLHPRFTMSYEFTGLRFVRTGEVRVKRVAPAADAPPHAPQIRRGKACVALTLANSAPHSLRRRGGARGRGGGPGGPALPP
eukprot:gene7549-18073_t